MLDLSLVLGYYLLIYIYLYNVRDFLSKFLNDELIVI